jgi:hypothetical protein
MFRAFLAAAVAAVCLLPGVADSAGGVRLEEGSVVVTGGPQQCLAQCLQIERHGSRLVVFAYHAGKVVDVFTRPLGEPDAHVNSATLSGNGQATWLRLDDGNTTFNDPGPPPAVPPDFTGVVTLNMTMEISNAYIVVVFYFFFENGELVGTYTEERTIYKNQLER